MTSWTAYVSEGQRVFTYFFLMASARPTRPALLTKSARLTLPISWRFIFEGLGSINIHSGTVEPDCRITFAMLRRNMLVHDVPVI